MTIEQGLRRDRVARQEHARLECPTGLPRVGAEIVGRSSALRAVLQRVAEVAPTRATVLIQGETGTGKELIAQAIHKLSSRRDRMLAKISCATIPSGLLESELFGHEKGAFTGAMARKTGRLELAHQGTLFLDEVGDIPLDLQPKLLRVLQEQQFERLGSTQTRQVNVRLVAATNRDLSEMVRAGQFRSDLFYRLNIFPIRLPPLRDRPEDVPLLVQHFVNKCAREMNKVIRTVPPEVMRCLRHYPWPGNVRELENFIQRAVIMSPGEVLSPPLAELEPPSSSPVPVPTGIAARISTLAECERDHIRAALNETGWVVGGPNGAAVLLGLKRTTLIWKMQKLAIHRKAERFRGPGPGSDR